MLQSMGLKRAWHVWETEQQQHFCVTIIWNKIQNISITPDYFSSIQSLSRVRLFVTPWTAASQVSLSITNSWSLCKLMSVELVMPSNHLILYHPLLLLPSSFLAFCIRSPKYWSFSFSISPSNDFSGLISFRMDWLDLNCPIHFRRNHTRSLQSLV